MAFIEQTFYGIICDGCGQQWEDGDGHEFMDDKAVVEEWAIESDWQISDCHFCDKCANSETI